VCDAAQELKQSQLKASFDVQSGTNDCVAPRT
jgi:hypothetical protein